MRILVIQAYRAKTRTKNGLYLLTPREDVPVKTRANIAKLGHTIATRAKVPDALLRVRHRSIKSARITAREAGFETMTVQQITHYAR